MPPQLVSRLKKRGGVFRGGNKEKLGATVVADVVLVVAGNGADVAVFDLKYDVQGLVVVTEFGLRAREMLRAVAHEVGEFKGLDVLPGGVVPVGGDFSGGAFGYAIGHRSRFSAGLIVIAAH